MARRFDIPSGNGWDVTDPDPDQDPPREEGGKIEFGGPLFKSKLRVPDFVRLYFAVILGLVALAVGISVAFGMVEFRDVQGFFWLLAGVVIGRQLNGHHASTGGGT
jgi:hypothetical protein